MTSPYPSNPDWPVHWRKSTLTGKFVAADGSLLAGETLTLTPAPDVVMVPDDDTIIAPTPIVIVLDSHGAFTRDVPATDDANITPRGWTYTVVESWSNGRTYSIEAPRGQTVDLTLLAPMGKYEGVLMMMGRPGSGAQEYYSFDALDGCMDVLAGVFFHGAGMFTNARDDSGGSIVSALGDQFRTPYMSLPAGSWAPNFLALRTGPLTLLGAIVALEFVNDVGAVFPPSAPSSFDNGGGSAGSSISGPLAPVTLAVGRYALRATVIGQGIEAGYDVALTALGVLKV